MRAQSILQSAGEHCVQRTPGSQRREASHAAYPAAEIPARGDASVVTAYDYPSAVHVSQLLAATTYFSIHQQCAARGADKAFLNK